MMRIIVASLLVTASAGGALLAQNSDLAFLVGATLPASQVVVGSNTRISGSTGASYQVNFAFQVLQRLAGDLYVELPYLIAENVNGQVLGATLTGSNRSLLAFTPGIRYKLPTQSRVAFYGVLGGGVGWIGFSQDVVAGSSTTATNTHVATAVLDFGAGIDCRLTRILSLRAEGRDLVTRSGIAGFEGHNHPIFQFGVALHF
jgi:hypothetical protein